MKSGNLNFLETSGPLQACNGTDLPFTYVNKFQFLINVNYMRNIISLLASVATSRNLLSSSEFDGRLPLYSTQLSWNTIASSLQLKEEEEVYILIKCIVLSQAGREIGYLVSVNYKALFCHIPSACSDGPLFDLTQPLSSTLLFKFRSYMTFRSDRIKSGKN